MAKKIFITATNTNIGKTYTTLKMLHYYASQGLRVGAIKPVETGVVNGVYPDGDLILSTLKELNQECFDLQIEDVVPISYELPAAPYIASRGAMFDFDTLTSAIEKIEERCDVLLIEGAGGLLVPLDYSFMMIDLIGFLNASALLVTHCSLGCINDTLLSLQALEQRNINSVVAFNCRDNDASFAKVSEPYFIKKQKEVLKVDKEIDTICNILYNL